MADPRFLTHFTPTNPQAGQGPVPQDMGFAAWSDNPSYCVTSGAGPAGAGVLALRRFSLPGAMVISSIWLDVGTAGVTLTANQCFAGVWDGNGVIVGLTQDASANFMVGGLLQMNLTGASGLPGQFGIDTPYCYAGYWYNGTTPPFMSRANVAENPGFINGNTAVTVDQARAVVANSGLTVITSAPLVLGTKTKNTSSNALFWVGLS